MTESGLVSQCVTCWHYRRLDEPGHYCEAFPVGIPEPIYANQIDHRTPVESDHGIRWRSNGDSFPEQAFDPANLALPPIG